MKHIRRVFVWSVPDWDQEKLVKYMLENGGAGQGWDAINVEKLINEEDFIRKHEEIYGEVRDDALTTFRYLKFRKDHIREGDIIVLKIGNTPYAVGIAKGEARYNKDALPLKIPNWVDVEWIIHNNGKPLHNFPKFRKARVLGVEQTYQFSEFYKKKVEEVLNAQKFRGED